MVLTPKPFEPFRKLPVCSVSCGEDHVVALTCTGLVYTWGNGEHFQLGRKVIKLRTTNGLRLNLRNIVVVGTGEHTSFAVDRQGVVFAFGLNQMRQTGVSHERGGQADTIKMPTQVDGLHPNMHGGVRVIQISGGLHHTIFLFDNGEVWGCGRCDGSRLGLPKSHPAMLDIAQRYEEELRSAQHRTSVSNKRLIVLPLEPKIFADTRIAEPARITFPPPLINPGSGQQARIVIVSIDAGQRYTMACDENGTLYSWGEGTSNQLGLGPAQMEAETPTRILNTALRKYQVVGMSAGGYHVFVRYVAQCNACKMLLINC
jgi:regulator of chromosome condensation